MGHDCQLIVSMLQRTRLQCIRSRGIESGFAKKYVIAKRIAISFGILLHRIVFLMLSHGVNLFKKLIL